MKEAQGEGSSLDAIDSICMTGRRDERENKCGDRSWLDRCSKSIVGIWKVLWNVLKIKTVLPQLRNENDDSYINCDAVYIVFSIHLILLLRNEITRGLNEIFFPVFQHM